MSQLSLRNSSGKEESLKQLASENKQQNSCFEIKDEVVAARRYSLSAHQQSKLEFKPSTSSISDQSQREQNNTIEESNESNQQINISQCLDEIARSRSVSASPIMQLFQANKKTQAKKQNRIPSMPLACINQKNSNDSDSSDEEDDEEDNVQEEARRNDLRSIHQMNMSPKQMGKMESQKIQNENITNNMKENGILSSDNEQNKRKTSITMAKYLLSLDFVDIKNPEHSQFALELLSKKKAKIKLEKQFLFKILRCCSVFQKNKNLIQEDNISLRALDLISYQFMPKNSIVFNQGEYGNTYYIVLTGEVFCLIPDPDHKSKEKFISEQLQKRKAYFHENPYTKRENIFNKIEKLQPKNKKNDQSPQNGGKDLDLSFKKIEKDQQTMVVECFPTLKQVHIFKSGESFGDIALITNDRRTATLVCKEDTHFITLTKEGYEQMIGIYEQRILEETIHFLRSFSYFKNIVRSRLLQILCWMKEQTFYKKNILYKENDLSNTVYFIRSGEIEISQATDVKDNSIENQISENSSNIFRKDNDRILELNSVKRQRISKMNTKRVQLVILSANQYFGQDEILDNNPKRMQQAQCISQSAHVYCLPKQRFTDMIRLNHTSIENIRNEEKGRNKWKVERLQMIQQTNKQNKSFPKNNQLENSSLIKESIQLMEMQSPINSLKSNSLNKTESSFISLNTSSDSVDISKLSRFDYGDSVIEKNQSITSEKKRNFYSQIKNKPNNTQNFNSSFQKCSNILNFGESDSYIKLSQTKEYATIDSQNQLYSQLNSPSKQLNSPYIARRPSKVNSKHIIGFNTPQISPKKCQKLSQNSQNVSDKEQSYFVYIENSQKDNMMNNQIENETIKEQKINISSLFKSQLSSYISTHQKNQINLAFQKRHSNQYYQSQSFLQNINNHDHLQASIQGNNPNKYHQLISSVQCNGSINPQSSSHLEYLKMVHQSLIAKQGILNQLKQSSFHNQGSNSNKQQTGLNQTLGDLSNSFQRIFLEDAKAKHSTHFRQNSTLSQTKFKLPVSQLSSSLNTSKSINQQQMTQNSKGLSTQMLSPIRRQSLSKTSSSLQRDNSQQYNSIQNDSGYQKIEPQQTLFSALSLDQTMHNTENIKSFINESEEINLNQSPTISIFNKPNSDVKKPHKKLKQLESIFSSKNFQIQKILKKSASYKQKQNHYFGDLQQPQQSQKQNYQKYYLNNDDENPPQHQHDENKTNPKSNNNEDFYNITSISMQIREGNPSRNQSFQLPKQENKGNIVTNHKNNNCVNIDSQHDFQQQTESSYQQTNLMHASTKLNTQTQTPLNQKNEPLPNINKVRKEVSLDSKNSNTYDKLTLNCFNSPQRKKKFIFNDIQRQQQNSQQCDNQNDKNQQNLEYLENQMSKQQDLLLANQESNQKNHSNLQNDFQNLIDLRKIGKSLQLEKIVRKSKDKNLLNKLVEQQQAKVQYMYNIKNKEKIESLNILSNQNEKKEIVQSHIPSQFVKLTQEQSVSSSFSLQNHS